MKRFITLVVTTILLTHLADAQRVKRKGTTPLMKKSKDLPVKADYTTDQLTGKWQEVSRIDKAGNTPVAIEDTLFINFLGNNKAESREGTYPKMTGSVEIGDGNILSVVADAFKIESLTDDKMVLDNLDNFIHTFEKKEQYWSDMVGKDSVAKEKLLAPIAFTIDSVIGNWMVYRRQAAPGATQSATNIIRYIKITQKTGADAAKGEITFANNGQSEVLPCVITSTKNGLHIAADKNIWLFPVFKAGKEELVFGHQGEMMYYCKPLK